MQGCECLPGEMQALYQYTFVLEARVDQLRDEVSCLLRLLALNVAAPPSAEVATAAMVLLS